MGTYLAQADAIQNESSQVHSNDREPNIFLIVMMMIVVEVTIVIIVNKTKG